MSDPNSIAAFLEAAGIRTTGAVISDGLVESRYFAFVEVGRDSKNRQVPTNKTLLAARDALAAQDLHIEFVLTDGQHDDAEAGLRATLLYGFGSDIRNVFLSTQGSAAHIWLDTKRELKSTVKDEIRERVSVFLSQLRLQVTSITPLSGQNLPTKTALLRVIRAFAPVQTNKLAEILVDRGFSVPSKNWLARQLDVHRKQGLVVRLHSGAYAISLVALTALGTSKKGAQSADVSRLLALARMGG